MSSLSDNLDNDIDSQLGLTWNVRVGSTVPTSETITLRDGAVEIDATYVYADLGNSSGLAQIMKKEVTAKIMRSYLAIATRTLRYYNGFIRSFDGDRVMGIFVGANKETSAVRAALAINWAAYDLLKPKIGATWTDVLGAWKFDHGIGIDTGMAMLVRGGVRNDNDIISIGSAPNVAAKLSEIRDKKNIMITQAVYTAMSNDVAFTDHTLSVNMWQKYNSLGVGGSYFDILGSSYKWRP